MFRHSFFFQTFHMSKATGLERTLFHFNTNILSLQPFFLQNIFIEYVLINLLSYNKIMVITYVYQKERIRTLGRNTCPNQKIFAWTISILLNILFKGRDLFFSSKYIRPSRLRALETSKAGWPPLLTNFHLSAFLFKFRQKFHP